MQPNSRIERSNTMVVLPSLDRTLQYNPRSDRYSTIGRSNTISVLPNLTVKVKTKKIFEVDRACWKDMIDLAENYHRQHHRESISYANAKFGDRLILRYCQLWHDENRPGEFLVRLKSED